MNVDIARFEENEKLNLTEENLMLTLDKLLAYENIPRYGEETEQVYNKAIKYMEQQDLAKKVVFNLSDYLCETADTASTSGYLKGFKDGVILLRTLMHL